MSPLDPKFSTLLAKGVLQRAASMPEREVVSALNVCTTMSAKAKLMQNKGMTKDVDPLTEIRAWYNGTVLVESAETGDTDQNDDDAEHTEFKEVDDGRPSGQKVDESQGNARLPEAEGR